ncbi:MAG: hypothetical protein IJT83_09815 [Victivallales bacterium]|nr:hypothetical protein [Victivallales bacterium]
MMKRLWLMLGCIIGVMASVTAFEVALDKGDALWQLENISAEVMVDALRLRETGEADQGIAKTPIPVKDAKYLQLVAGASENPLHYLSIGNADSPMAPRGCVFQGVNTFPLPDKDFTLALTLRGPQGDTPGGWYDVKAIRTVEVPTGGVVITAEKPVVKVGDSFRVEYYAEPGSMLPSALPLQVFLESSMAPVTFGLPIELRDDGANGDLRAGDGVYSALVKVTEDASCLQYKQGKPLPGSALCFSVLLPASAASYGVADFAFDVATKNVPHTTWTRMTPTTVEYRRRWENAVAGKINLAAGKPVDFSVAPNFRLTMGQNNTDRFDLTDGKLTLRGDDVLRFDSNAVGWRRSGNNVDLFNGIDMLIDLEKVEPVGKVVIRINCGNRINPVQRSPKKLAVLVSRDGVQYYEAAPPMMKLEPGEKEQSDFRRQYFLEEDDENIFCFPFELAVNANARFVMVRVVPDGGNLYCDELAVLKAENPASISEAVYDGIPEKKHTDGCVLSPAYHGDFYIADNLPAPNYFGLRDFRPKATKAPMQMVVELPAGILCRNTDVATEAIEKQGVPYTRFTKALPGNPGQLAHQMEHEPLFFQAPKGMNTSGKAFFYATLNGKPSFITERNIVVLTMPEVSQGFRGLTVLSRMGIGDKAWPGYLDNLRKLGFSGAQIYPYIFMRGGNDHFHPDYIAAVEEAHRTGIKIVIGFNGLLELYRDANNPSEEVWCQTDNPKHNYCPSFRGREYQNELAKITRSVAMFKPSFIQWDVEHWGSALQGMRNCARCQERWKKTGKSWEEFLDMLSVELNRDLTEAVALGARQASIKMPAIYNYNRQPLTKSYQGFEKWELNKQFVAGPQPSLYVSGEELRVHNSIKANFDCQSDRSQRIIAPVLTPGTYGPYEPYHLEQMIYETMMNGAMGFFYYPWRGFISPVFFYYHAKAMQNVVNHQDLIFNGEIYTPKCDNAEMIASGVKSADEALVLLGNYLGAREYCIIEPPFKEGVVTDVLTGKQLTPSDLRELKVPNHRVRLLHWKR